jgi:hypothetical protein
LPMSSVHPSLIPSFPPRHGSPSPTRPRPWLPPQMLQSYMCMLEAALAALRELGSRAKNIGVLGVFGEGQGDAGQVLIAQRSWFRLPRVRRNPFSYSSNSVLNFLCLSSEVNILY